MTNLSKSQAYLEFGLNLIHQKILTEQQFLKYNEDANFRFFEFELGYWLELNDYLPPLKATIKKQ